MSDRQRVEHIRERLRSAPDLGGHWLYGELLWLCEYALAQRTANFWQRARLKTMLKRIDAALEAMP